MDLPNDPVMLLSVINMELRDRYKSLDELCDDRQLDKAALCAKLVPRLTALPDPNRQIWKTISANLTDSSARR